MNTSKQRWTFISYSRRDKGFALELARELKSAGYLVWLDQLDIPTGARWDDEVERALRESEIFLIILTPASTSSENVKDEIGYAVDHGKRILPILMEECEVPLRLRRFQYIDFTKMEFRDGVKRAKQLLETLINEQSTPVVKINLEHESQKVLNKEATLVPLLPIQNRSFRRRWIVGGVGVLAFVACLGALGALTIFRGFIFSPVISPQSQVPTLTAIRPSTLPTAGPNEQLILVAEGGNGRLFLVERLSRQIRWQKDGLREPICVTIMRNGHILVCENDGVTEIDTDGNVINTLKGVFETVIRVQPLDNDTILVSDCGKGTVMAMDWSGNVTWSVSELHCPSESIRLSNGNTLVADGTASLREFYPDGTVAWSAKLANWAAAIQRLSNGQTIVGEADGVELLDEAGQVIWAKKGFDRITSVQQLPSGDFLLAEPDKGRILVLSQTGDILWIMSGLNLPWDAIFLP